MHKPLFNNVSAHPAHHPMLSDRRKDHVRNDGTIEWERAGETPVVHVADPGFIQASWRVL